MLNVSVSVWVETDMSAGVSTDATGGVSAEIGVACFKGTVFFFFILFLLFNAGVFLAFYTMNSLKHEYNRHDKGSRFKW